MIRRLAAAVFLAWALGFLWFSLSLPGPSRDEKSDAVVVPTGGQGRIARGLEVLGKDQAKLMLVTGVAEEVKPVEFAVEYEVDAALMDCCITLGRAAVDTKGNATEAARWVAQRKVTSLRLVTTDWHMRRAALELEAALPGTVTVIEDAVVSQPSFRILFLEYHKLIAAWISRVWPF